MKKLQPIDIDLDSFSEARAVRFPRLPVVERSALIASLAHKRNILHVGCCDHFDLIEAKMAAGNWLHDTLLRTGSDVLGVDIDTRALALCQHLRPDAAFLRWNILAEDPPSSMSRSYDWCLLPEIIEHLGDPVPFLSVLRTRLAGRCSRILCTVPNAFLLGNFTSALRGVETINTDHRHWYTPFTILKVLRLAGFTDFEMCMLRYQRPPSIRSTIKRVAESLFPFLASGIAVSASLGSPTLARVEDQTTSPVALEK